MNHGPLFKKLDSEIKRAVRAERAKGYYGDGFYSSGIHLASGITVESDPLNAGEAPEYICGGAADRQAPGKKARTGRAAGGGKKRLRAGDTGFTVGGAQTAKRRKAGSSNTRAFEGREDAIRIDGTEEPSKDELKRLKALVKERVSVLRQSEGLTIKKAEEKALNSLTSAERRLIETNTHGKRANTANARDARAAHFERLLATKTESKPISEDDSRASSAKEEIPAESDDSDTPENEEDLEEYAKGFLAEMDEDERKIARGDYMDLFEDEGAPSRFRTSADDETAERGNSIVYRSSTAQGAKTATDRVGLDSASHRSSPLPTMKQSGSPIVNNNVLGFGRAMIDDEKRNTQAGLLGMNSSNGQMLESTRSRIAEQDASDVKYWTCPASNCDNLNPANRNKCAKCSRHRVRDVPPSDGQRDVIVIDD